MQIALCADNTHLLALIEATQYAGRQWRLEAGGQSLWQGDGENTLRALLAGTTGDICI